MSINQEPLIFPVQPLDERPGLQFKNWLCKLCGFSYSELEGRPEDGIKPGTRWDDVSDDWFCPDCGVGKIDFEMVEV